MRSTALLSWLPQSFRPVKQKTALIARATTKAANRRQHTVMRTTEIRFNRAANDGLGSTFFVGTLYGRMHRVSSSRCYDATPSNSYLLRVEALRPVFHGSLILYFFLTDDQ